MAALLLIRSRPAGRSAEGVVGEEGEHRRRAASVRTSFARHVRRAQRRVRRRDGEGARAGLGLGRSDRRDQLVPPSRTDAQRERHRDEPHHRGRDEHQVIVTEHVVREAPGERRERRTAHVREEDPAVQLTE